MSNALSDMAWYALDVNPEPWAIGPVGYARRNGKMSAYVGRNAQLDAYKEAIREAIGTGHTPIQGKVRLVVFFWRDRADYETPQARRHRKHEADATNLLKATEDALQGILFENDRDNNDVRAVVVEQGPGVTGRVLVGVAPSAEVPDIVSLIPNHAWELFDHQQLKLPLDGDAFSPNPTEETPF